MSGWGDWAFPGAHVGFDEVDAVVPGVDVVLLEEDVGVGVLFDGPELDFDARGFAGAEGSRD